MHNTSKGPLETGIIPVNISLTIKTEAGTVPYRKTDYPEKVTKAGSGSVLIITAVCVLK